MIYSISIKATDADGFSSISFVNFTVLENLIPIAVITDDVISAGDFNHLGHRVRLSSEKSSDPENSYLRKSWKLESKPSNSTIDISGDDYNDSLWFWPDVSGTYPAYSLTSYYTNITPDLPGVYSLQLTVTDPDGSSDSKTHSFTITNW